MTAFASRLAASAAALVLAAGAASAQPAAAPPPAPAAAPAPATDAGPRLFTDSKVVVRDRISVEVVGQGPDVILVPGLASSRETWKATAERLRGRYRLHIVQVAGFAGETARANAAGPILAPTAEAIDAYIVEARLGPATYVGHSLGGTIGLWLAEHHPEHLKKVLVVDSLPWLAPVMVGPQASMDQVKAITARIRANPTAGGGGGAMAARLVTGPADQAMVAAWSAASDPAVVAGALSDDLELDLSPGLAAIPVPITLLYPDNVSLGAPAGAMEQVYPPAFAAVPHKTLKRIDASRHFIMLDQPKAFADALDAFLAG